MSDTQIDRQVAMIAILQAVVDLDARGTDNLLHELPKAVPDVPEAELHQLVVTLKSSRCLDATVSVDPDGNKSVESVDGITTRGLRELQKSWEGPVQQHSCPTDGDEGRLGFFG